MTKIWARLEKRRNHRDVALVAGVVEVQPDPMQILANPVPDASGILSDPAAEDKCIETVQSSGEPAQFTPDAEHEKVDRFLRLGRPGSFKFAHIAAEAGQAFEAGLFIKEVGNLFGRHSFVIHQIEHDGRVELPASRSHGKPSSGEKPMVEAMLLPSGLRTSTRPRRDARSPPDRRQYPGAIFRSFADTYS